MNTVERLRYQQGGMVQHLIDGMADEQHRIAQQQPSGHRVAGEPPAPLAASSNNYTVWRRYHEDTKDSVIKLDDVAIDPYMLRYHWLFLRRRANMAELVFFPRAYEGIPSLSARLWL